MASFKYPVKVKIQQDGRKAGWYHFIGYSNEAYSADKMKSFQDDIHAALLAHARPVLMEGRPDLSRPFEGEYNTDGTGRLWKIEFRVDGTDTHVGGRHTAFGVKEWQGIPCSPVVDGEEPEIAVRAARVSALAAALKLAFTTNSLHYVPVHKRGEVIDELVEATWSFYNNEKAVTLING